MTKELDDLLMIKNELRDVIDYHVKLKTQTQISNETGFSQSFISRIINNVDSVKLATLYKLVSCLGYHIYFTLEERKTLDD